MTLIEYFILALQVSVRRSRKECLLAFGQICTPDSIPLLKGRRLGIAIDTSYIPSSTIGNKNNNHVCKLPTFYALHASFPSPLHHRPTIPSLPVFLLIPQPVHPD